MGNALSWNPLVARSSEGSAASVLSEKDAWDFAMAWRSQIQGCVRLEKDPARGDFQLIDAFEWVVFVLNGEFSDGLQEVLHPLETVAYARAASIVWFALSCCKGYSAEENPRFWRRVFTELVVPVYPKGEIVLIKTDPYRTQAVITDAVRFFGRIDGQFPRVMLVPKRDYESQCVSIFLGRELVANASRDRLLERILVRLEPFMIKHRWNRSLDVAIDEVPASWLGPMLSKPSKALELNSDDHQGCRLQVKLKLVSLFVNASDFRNLTSKNRQGLMGAGCDIVLLPCAFDRLLVSRKLPDYISPLAHSPEENKSRLCFQLIKLTEALGSASRDIEVLCSALPHLQAITAVQVTSQQSPWSRNVTTDAGWAWLGYAIFHPDAETKSAFTDLDIKFYGVQENNIEKLTAMATGNNLLYAISNDETQRSSAYHQAQVQETTKVQAQDYERAPAFYQLTSESWVDLCVSSTEAIPTDGYVRAVVPGIGLGWIHSQDIIQIRSRPAGRSCLRRLRVSTRRLLDEFDELHRLLAAICGNLTYLEIQDHTPLLPSDLHEILSHTPSLKCLRIKHDGTYWTSSSAEIHPPHNVHLEELELRIDKLTLEMSSLQPLDSLFLQKMKALCIKTSVGGSLASNHESVLSMLESHQALEYFHWSGTPHTRDSWWPLTYDQRRERTLRFCETLTKGVHDTCRGPLTVECRLALLSVIQSKAAEDKPTPLRLFGQDIVRHIIGFASRSTARELWITD